MGDPTLQLVLFALLGLVSGFASGLFGIGGGVIRIPIFMAVFPLIGVRHDVLMHMAVGTSVALVIPTAVAATWKQISQGNLDTRFLAIWSVGIVAGVGAGLLVVPLVSTHLFKLIFALFLLGIAVYMGFFVAGTSVGSGALRESRSIPAGSIVGFVSILTGTGGGTFATPALKALGVPLNRAIATASATGLVIGATGSAGFLYHGLGVADRPAHAVGYVDPLVFLSMTPAILISAPLGVKFGNAMNKLVLQRAFAVLALIVALQILGQFAP